MAHSDAATPRSLAEVVETRRNWWPELDTPALVVDRDIVERNVAEMAAQIRDRGLALRPHFKTHKCVEVAALQERYGAVGQTCATLGEAEALADAGFDDVFVAYPIWPGGPKRQRLRELNERVTLSVGVDSVEGARQLAAATRGSASPLRVLVEVDTGGRRSGVPAGDVVEIATEAARAGLEVRGVFTHGGHSYGVGDTAERAAREEVAGLEAAVARLQAHDIPTPVVSAGSTPTALLSATGVVTEERPGTYVFGDRQQVEIGSCRLEDVALVIASTVVSRAVDGQVVMDAGTKSLAREIQPWLSGYGLLPQWPWLTVERLYDHHGVAHLPAGRPGPSVGDVVAVVPNHVCPVVNLVPSLVVVRGEDVVDRWRVVAQSAV